MRKRIFVALTVMPLIASGALASNTLTDLQLDSVTAGQILGVECPGCTLSSSTSTSTNGVTKTTSSTQIVGGNSGGGTGGNSGGGGGNDGGSGPGVVTTIPVPARAAAVISGATTLTITSP